MSLKTCPFCGANYGIVTMRPDGLSYVRCDLCGATGPTDMDLNKTPAASWNERMVYPDYLSYAVLRKVLDENLSFHAVLSNCKIYNETNFIRFYLPHLRLQLKFFDNGTWEVERDAGPEETH